MNMVRIPSSVLFVGLVLLFVACQSPESSHKDKGDAHQETNVSSSKKGVPYQDTYVSQGPCCIPDDTVTAVHATSSIRLFNNAFSPSSCNNQSPCPLCPRNLFTFSLDSLLALSTNNPIGGDTVTAAASIVLWPTLSQEDSIKTLSMYATFQPCTSMNASPSTPIVIPELAATVGSFSESKSIISVNYSCNPAKVQFEKAHTFSSISNDFQTYIHSLNGFIATNGTRGVVSPAYRFGILWASIKKHKALGATHVSLCLVLDKVYPVQGVGNTNFFYEPRLITIYTASSSISSGIVLQDRIMPCCPGPCCLKIH